MKYVLITGASSDIGMDIAKKLACNGYNLILCYYSNLKKVNLLEQDLKKYDNVVLVYKLDISDENSIIDLKKKLAKMNITLDILINLASICLDNFVDDKTKEEFMRVLEVNVVGTFLCIKHFSKLMNKGLILNMSSTDGLNTYNNISIDYCVSKAGIDMLTKTFAMEYNDIKVISVAPNWVNTDSVRAMNNEYLESELKRIGQKQLIEVDSISENILKIINKDQIKSGSIIRIEE